jgi:hypothetical protein
MRMDGGFAMSFNFLIVNGFPALTASQLLPI